MSQTPALLRSANLSLKFESGPYKGQEFQFSKASVRIGRDPDNEIVLSNDQKVSRHHVELQFLKGQWSISNVSSGNHLLVNGEMTKNRPLLSSVKVKVGDSVFSVQSDSFLLNGLPVSVPSPRKSGPIGIVKNESTSLRSTKISEPLLEPGTSDRITKILIGIGVVIGALYFMQPDQKAIAKKNSLMKRPEETIIDIKKSEEVVENLNKKRNESNKDKIQFQMAQEQFLRGFRDYKQGQYGVAYTELGAALTLYPEHKLARTYYEKARNKFYAKVEVLMTEGKRYLGTNNYRLCKGAFQSAMVMLKVETDPLYKESNQYFLECSRKIEEGNSQ